MRIVMIVPAFPKSSETFIVNKFLGLLERGVDVHVVCQRSDSSDWERFPQLQQRRDIKRRIHVGAPTNSQILAALRIPVIATRSLARNLHPTTYYMRHGLTGMKRLYVDTEILSLKPDIVHFEFGALAVGRTYLKEWAACRLVVSFRGYDLNYSGLENPDYYREVWDRADMLHLVSKDLWRRAQHRGCPPSKQHRIVTPAIDTDAFDAGERTHEEIVGIAERPLRLLSVGRLEWKKGHEFALEAIAHLQRAGIACNYTIVGGGSYIEAVAFARHQMGLTETVHLLGTQPRAEVIQQLRQADIFLHPAVSEGFCNAAIEAQAMGLPIVSTDADGLSENIADGVTGLIVPRRDPRAMADKLALLAGDPALRQKMSVAGRQRAKTHFRQEDQISAFLRMYEDVLSAVN